MTSKVGTRARVAVGFALALLWLACGEVPRGGDGQPRRAGLGALESRASSAGQWSAALAMKDTQRDSLKSRALFTPANEAQRVIRAVSIRLMGNRLTGPIVKKVMHDRGLKAKMIDIVAQ